MQVNTIGHVCIDKNHSEGAEYEFFGSPAMYMSLVFTKLKDVDYGIVTSYGPDFLKYAQGLRLFPARPNTGHSLVYRNVTVGGRRTQQAFFRKQLPPPLDANLQKLLSGTDIMLFSPLLPNYSLSELQAMIAELPSGSLKVMLPQGFFRNFDKDDKVIFRSFTDAEAFIGLFDFTILSDQDYPDVLTLAAKWAKATGKNVIITMGDQGARLFTPGEAIQVPTTPIKNIVDSVGAGDVFSAAFAHQFKLCGDAIASIRYANKIAGRSLQFTPQQMQTRDFVNK